MPSNRGTSVRTATRNRPVATARDDCSPPIVRIAFPVGSHAAGTVGMKAESVPCGTLGAGDTAGPVASFVLPACFDGVPMIPRSPARWATTALLTAAMAASIPAVAQSVPAARAAPPENAEYSDTVIRPALVAPPHDDFSITQHHEPSGYSEVRDRSLTGEFSCASQDYDYNECSAPPGRISLVERHSSAPCRPGRDWGIGYGHVWVDNGCRATFRAR